MSNPEISTFVDVQASSSPKETTSMASVVGRFQAHLMRRMDSLVKAVEAAVPDLSYLQACTEQLTTIAAAFERRHASLLETGDEVQWEEEEKRYDEFERRRFELTVLLKRREAEMCVSNTKAQEYAVPNTDAQDPRVSNPKSKVRLPEIPLPNFDGALESWPTFRDAFSSMIDGHPGLSDVDKLIYLKRVVSKEAAQVIDAVETTGANYSVAWELLKNRYENKKVLVRRYLDDLSAISPAKRESYESLTILLDGFERTIKMVEKVGVCTNGWNVLLAHMLCDKLDSNTRKEWDTHHRSSEVADYEELVKFLRQHAMVLQALPSAKETAPHAHTNHGRQKWKQACATVNVVEKKCTFCNRENHSAFKCDTFRNLPVNQRYDKVKEKGLCINCLAPDHRVRECTSSTCRVCKLKHHTMLHRTPIEPSSTVAASVPESTATTSTRATSFIEPDNTVMLTPTANQPVPTTSILLPTVLLTVVASNGNKMIARALLDGGAQVNLITERLVQGLRAQRLRDHLAIGAVGRGSQTSTHSVNVVIHSQYTNFCFPLRLHVLPEIMWNLPSVKVDQQQWELPPNVKLADPTCAEIGAIDMLLGREVYNEILLKGLVRLRSGENNLLLQETSFGWVVSGKTMICRSLNQRSLVNVACIDESLDERLKQFWEIEACQSGNMFSPEESKCEAIFESTTKRGIDGKFIVALPKDVERITKIGNSYEIAKRRLHSLNRRLNANPELKQQYQEFLDEYVQLNHMEEISSSSKVINEPTYYMPHHCIIRPDSLTTKLRVVFDASCATESGVSLNDALLVGPVIQDDLISIVLRFRIPRYALTADIEKMYRQIWIREADRPLQRILWGDENGGGIREFQLKTVTYGTSSAPYLATKCLQALANEANLSYPIASKILKSDFYMDDMISGVDTVEQGRLVCNELSELLHSAGFHLRKWASNSVEILNSLPPDLREMGSELLIDPHKSIKTLGLKWNPAKDVLTFSIPKWHKEENITKRTVVSDAARLYNPLGLIGPVIVMAKCFLQVLWEKKVGWDEPLEEELRVKWKEFKQGIVDVEEIAVPRRVIGDEANSIEIHGFSDASERAYGACLYMRTISAKGTITVQLLCAKSRVAPIENGKRQKRVTLPRLELSGALLLCHLWQKVKASLKQETKGVFWVDSTIVLHWIAANPSRWKPFVANRVSEIQHITDRTQWFHVSGEDNPADIISRGMSPSELLHSELWWHGPKWLRHSNEWVSSTTAPDVNFTPEQLEERTLAMTVTSKATNPLFALRSSYSALLRLVAYILRFCHNSKRVNRHQRRSGVLQLVELRQASNVLVRMAQAETFAEEIKSVKNGQVKGSSKLKSLAPILVDDILCVGGRLQNAPVSNTRKHPIILDPNHPLTTLIMQSYHQQFKHAAPQLLISLVRERFWPLRARNLARRVVHNCVKCFRSKPTCMEQLMGDLPPERVTPTFPFLNTGVDLCGPLWYRLAPRKATPMKCFVVVFVCLVTKAVHVELVADLSTQAFISALKRFVARRGKPALIECDNAKNFRGAARVLKELYDLFKSQQAQDAITTHCVSEGIEFKFIPPRSPNFGGLWEAAIKSLKKHLKCTIGATILLKEDLETLLIQIEACLNSRPLTQLSTDPEDLEVLTPGHFLIHRSLVSTAEPSYEGIEVNRLDRFQKIQEFVRRIWKQWKTDYLSGLHPRTKWTKQRNNISIGTMVLIKEDNLPPLKWAVGRVTRIFEGNDGNIRVVEVRTKEGEYRRCISKICVLPIQQEE